MRSAAGSSLPPSARRARDHLEQWRRELRELASVVLETRRGEARKQRLAHHLEGFARDGEPATGITCGEGALGVGDGARSSLHVDERIRAQVQPDLLAPDHHAVAYRRAQAREQRAEARLRRDGSVIGPQHVDQLVAADRAVAVQHEVGKQEAALSPGSASSIRRPPTSTKSGPQSRIWADRASG